MGLKDVVVDEKNSGTIILCERCGKKIPKSKKFKHEWMYCEYRYKDLYPEKYDYLRKEGFL